MANMPFVSGKVAQTALQAGLNDDSFGMGYKAQSDRDMQRAQADAKIAELIKNKTLDAEMQQAADIRKSDEEEAQYQRDLKTASELKGKYGPYASVNAGSVSIGGIPRERVGGVGGSVPRNANITGFNITDPENVMPSAKDREEVKKAAQAVKDMEGQAASLIPQVNNSKWADRLGTVDVFGAKLGTEKGRSLEQAKGALLDKARAMAGTGVLQPGEIPLLEKRVGEITGIGAMFRSPEEILASIEQLSEQLNNSAVAHATARGFTPKEGYITNPFKAGVKKQAAPKFNTPEEELAYYESLEQGAGK